MMHLLAFGWVDLAVILARPARDANRFGRA
jgi:hypothetical protein